MALMHVSEILRRDLVRSEASDKKDGYIPTRSRRFVRRDPCDRRQTLLAFFGVVVRRVHRHSRTCLCFLL